MQAKFFGIEVDGTPTEIAELYNKIKGPVQPPFNWAQQGKPISPPFSQDPFKVTSGRTTPITSADIFTTHITAPAASPTPYVGYNTVDL